jgi:hypothetical protein
MVTGATFQPRMAIYARVGGVAAESGYSISISRDSSGRSEM